MTEFNKNFYYWYAPRVYNLKTMATRGIGMVCYSVKNNDFNPALLANDLKTYHSIYDFCHEQTTIRDNLIGRNGTRIEYEL